MVRRQVRPDEQRVWELLTRDFRWEIPPGFPITLYGAENGTGAVRLQVFEVVVPRILARVRPEFSWQVTANHHDGGLDFRGEQRFLHDEQLQIAAAITVGGQCKKRTTVSTVLDEISGSVLTMARRFKPTFIVVALSARLTRDRVTDAQDTLQETCGRHCLILDREQIEGLIAQHLSEIEEILVAALEPPEVAEVLDYFAAVGGPTSPLLIADAAPPGRVLAGVPFDVDVTIRSTFVSLPGARAWWAPARRGGRLVPVTLMGPLGADTSSGVPVGSLRASDEVFGARFSLELLTYAVGSVELGELLIGHEDDGPDDPWARLSLGQTVVIENVRPRFFDRPLRAGTDALMSAYEYALGAGMATVGVTGAGGSGKSRLCEEFAAARKREGTTVIAVKQPKTHDDPYRILADLLLALSESDAAPPGDAARTVLDAVAGYDAALAARVSPALRSVFGTSDLAGEQMTEQDLLLALLVLIAARVRPKPLIVHLQDLHWCTADVLRVLERLVDQLAQTLAPRPPQSGTGVLVVLEGRVRERNDGRTSQAWSSVPFETFLERLAGPVVQCGAFSSDDGLEFVNSLFEQPHQPDTVTDERLDLQWDLVRRIDRSAGGSPFHSLEQIQLLKQRGVLAQNPRTGLLYAIRPEPDGVVLPDSVFAAIEMRWRYLRDRTPDLALLLWACSLLEDRLPAAVFHKLRRDLAPEISVHEVDSTDLLWTGDGSEQEVVFRHENYFESLRRFDVTPAERARAVESYAGWYETLTSPGPIDRFRWARVLLEALHPDLVKARSLLRTARRGAERQGDRALARRISAAELDLVWAADRSAPLPLAQMLRWSDQELALARELLDSDQAQGERRLTAVRERLVERLANGGDNGLSAARLQQRQLVADVLQAKFLFNTQKPDRATRLAGAAVRQIAVVRASTTEDQDAWDDLEMEALHNYAIALAIGGNVPAAIPISAAAVEIAWRRPTMPGRQTIGTHGNFLCNVDPSAGVGLLTKLLNDDAYAATATEADRIVIHLSIGQALLAHREASTDPRAAAALRSEARAGLTAVLAAAVRVGLHPDAGAAALMLGVISVLDGSDDAVSWFAQAVASAARGHQLETLWKAHFDLAMALHHWEAEVTPAASEHARAAIDLMTESLPAADPDRSPRFELLRIPLAHAVQLLVLAGDDHGFRTLERLPALRSSFLDPVVGLLRDDCGVAAGGRGLAMRVGDQDYVPY